MESDSTASDLMSVLKYVGIGCGAAVFLAVCCCVCKRCGACDAPDPDDYAAMASGNRRGMG